MKLDGRDPDQNKRLSVAEQVILAEQVKLKGNATLKSSDFEMQTFIKNSGNP